MQQEMKAMAKAAFVIIYSSLVVQERYGEDYPLMRKFLAVAVRL